MSDTKLLVPALIGIAVLVFVATILGWLLDHPTVIIVGVIGIGGLGYLLARRNAARNRV